MTELNDGIEVVIRSGSITPAVTQLINQLAALQTSAQTIALTIDKQVVLIEQHNIILIEVIGTEITVSTVDHTFHTHGQLKKMLLKLNKSDFIQVAKGSVLNLNHLKTLEPAFSGNMTAKLTRNFKVTISRKYLPALKKQLGM